MLTTTVDGLWVLQVLTGIEVLAPELGLRPVLPSVESPQAALAHPVAAELRDAGVITSAGEVDGPVLEWLTVLARRDLAVVLQIQTEGRPSAPERVMLTRFAQWWVALERSGPMVRLSAAGTADNERAAAEIITAQIARLCGDLPAAPLRPVTLDCTELLSTVRDRESLRRYLIGQRVDGDQLAALLTASDPDRSAQASIVAIQYGGPAERRSGLDSGVVTIIDTPEGRMLGEYATRDGRVWMIVAPGSLTQIRNAVQKMLRRLPAEGEWHSYRKAV